MSQANDSSESTHLLEKQLEPKNDAGQSQDLTRIWKISRDIDFVVDVDTRITGRGKIWDVLVCSRKEFIAQASCLTESHSSEKSITTSKYPNTIQRAIRTGMRLVGIEKSKERTVTHPYFVRLNLIVLEKSF